VKSQYFWIVPALFLTACAVPAPPQPAAETAKAPAIMPGCVTSTVGDTTSGKCALTLKTIVAYAKTGSRDPAYDQACLALYRGEVGQTVASSFSINVKTLIMSAASTFDNKTYGLPPLGIAGVYTFATFRPAPGIYAVNFSVTETFSLATSSILFSPAGKPFNCLVSS